MDDGAPAPFLSRRLPAALAARLVVVPAGGERPYAAGEWEDALVVVERGAVDLECRDGARHRVRRGDVLWLAGLPLRRLCNPGAEPAVLLAVRRRVHDPT